jgi:hypothetical protein
MGETVCKAWAHQLKWLKVILFAAFDNVGGVLIIV